MGQNVMLRTIAVLENEGGVVERFGRANLTGDQIAEQFVPALGIFLRNPAPIDRRRLPRRLVGSKQGVHAHGKFWKFVRSKANRCDGRIAWFVVKASHWLPRTGCDNTVERMVVQDSVTYGRIQH